MSRILLQLAGLFGSLSLVAVGGGNAAVPAMQHAVVDLHQWMSGKEFLDVYAISRATPGPGSLLVVLIGLKAAGYAGALVSLVAMFGPSCLLAHCASRVWRRFDTALWRDKAEQGLAPLAVGLNFAAGLALLQAGAQELGLLAITAAATLVLTVTEISPIIVMATAAAIGVAVLG